MTETLHKLGAFDAVTEARRPARSNNNQPRRQTATRKRKTDPTPRLRAALQEMAADGLIAPVVRLSSSD